MLCCNIYTMFKKSNRMNTNPKFEISLSILKNTCRIEIFKKPKNRLKITDTQYLDRPKAQKRCNRDTSKSYFTYLLNALTA